ncbi:histidine--tRNA ligase [Patescibacteria group bacterium]|nr:histidine--tRNA ligase [Patescibacteria group bacterium]MBU1966710.1 histidine--tRNA ligase [Patescibacteria group bacterium]MBU2542967.1 histidine--tRNA ligase [Patescibacteria group bacterium]
MSKQQIQTLKGFRDFLPAEKRQRDFVASKIIEIFEQFGFQPLETPTLEYASLLLGKYGDEADKLVYNFKDRGGREVALRYDQTVPTARVLAQYQNQLPRYFRRYQIQNVFRADKPQIGRYREFAQCDIDIFGSTSPLADAEIIACTYFSFINVGFKNIKLKINDRQVLFTALKTFVTDEVNIFSIIQSVDKLDKLSAEDVMLELTKKGLTTENAKSALEKIAQAKISNNLAEIIKLSQQLGVLEKDLVFTSTLARGLNYYTGMIFEVILPEYGSGSCGGGGRYDKLINQLGGVDIPAVGIAFGFDRTVEAATQLGLIPTDKVGTQVLVTVFDEKLQINSVQAATKLRQAGIKTELYPAIDSMSKQFKKADQANIPYAIVIGEEEIASNQVSLKNLKTGDQEIMSIDEVINKLV